MKLSSILFCFLVVFVFSFCSHSEEKSFRDFFLSGIKMPYDEFVKIQGNDVNRDNMIHIVKYYDDHLCTKCMLSKLIIDEKKTFLKDNQNINYLYIFSANRKDFEKELIQINNKSKICGQIYIDTSNVFIKHNPSISESMLYHTFVINNEGKVLMVGDPFENEKMEALFKKVIANEQGKKK